MNITGSTQIYGVSGNPIKHSFSPLIHNFLFSKLNIPAVYIPFEPEKDKFETFINGIQHLTNLRGMNVTVPFKNSAFKISDKLSREAEIIGSVNTLLFKDSTIEGYNTDSYGFLKSLNLNFPEITLKNSVAMVIGAGGASKAILYSLISSGIKKILLVNRTLSRADDLKTYFQKKLNFKDIQTVSLSKNIFKTIEKDIDILINTTSVGLHKDDKQLIEIPEQSGIKLVYDLIYNPPKTKLLSDAENKKIRILNGKDMLILQALRSFEIWTGKNTEKYIEEIRKILRG